MGLRIRLRPGERCIINGAVVTSEEKRITITVSNQAHVIKARDIMQLDDCDTPVKRVYFLIQLMLMDPLVALDRRPHYNSLMAEVLAIFQHKAAHDALVEAAIHVDDEDYYAALMALKPALDYERLLLANGKEAAA